MARNIGGSTKVMETIQRKVEAEEMELLTAMAGDAANDDRTRKTFGLEEFNRCSRSLGNPHVEVLQTIAHEGGIFLTAVRLGAYSEVGYLVPSYRVRTLGL